MKKCSLWGLLPILVFVVVYLGLGIYYEYILKINMGFYSIPVVGVFLIAICVASFQSRELSIDNQLELMAKGVGDKNILIMILIFMTAGVFVGVVGRSSAASVANCILSFVPSQFSAVAIFVISAFVSLSMGTSCGTITVIAPIAISMSDLSGFSLPLCLGAVMGGAMFGDNLSFISDTTIAACNGQGCPMQAKFKQNFAIALPAAIATLIITHFLATGQHVNPMPLQDYSLIQIIPYLLVLFGGIFGINVFLVLILGIFSGIIITFFIEHTAFFDIIKHIGSGASGMFETAMVAILVSALAQLIRYNGGFEALLKGIRKVFKGNKGGQFGVGILVGLMDIATANNTVAIVVATPIARDMSANYGISKEKTASILDTFSCIFQGIIPYGAQMLILLAAAHELGHTVSAFQVMPYLLYMFLLFISSMLFILFVPERKKS